MNVFWTTPQIVSVSLFTFSDLYTQKVPSGSLGSMSVHGLLAALSEEGEEEEEYALIVWDVMFFAEN